MIVRFARRAACCAAMLFFCCLPSRLLQAQARSTASGPGSFVAVGGGASIFRSNYGQQSLGGAFAFADIQPQWRFGLELEYRTLRFHSQEQVRQSSYLAGVRATWRPLGWSPYIKLLAGNGHIDLPFGYAQGDYLAVAPGGGLEYSFNERATLRVVDFEYQYWPQFSFGALKPYGLSTGLSFRLNNLSVYPKGARARH